jgi:hypothetical protein
MCREEFMNKGPRKKVHEKRSTIVVTGVATGAFVACATTIGASSDASEVSTVLKMILGERY